MSLKTLLLFLLFGSVVGDEISTAQSLQFDLSTIETATKNFAADNKLGEGGYGEVFLARKIETGEVCALKKMRKKTLFKMDEVRYHVFFQIQQR